VRWLTWLLGRHESRLRWEDLTEEEQELFHVAPWWTVCRRALDAGLSTDEAIRLAAEAQGTWGPAEMSPATTREMNEWVKAALAGGPVGQGGGGA